MSLRSHAGAGALSRVNGKNRAAAKFGQLASLIRSCAIPCHFSGFPWALGASGGANSRVGICASNAASPGSWCLRTAARLACQLCIFVCCMVSGRRPATGTKNENLSKPRTLRPPPCVVHIRGTNTAKTASAWRFMAAATPVLVAFAMPVQRSLSGDHSIDHNSV